MKGISGGTRKIYFPSEKMRNQFSIKLIAVLSIVTCLTMISTVSSFTLKKIAKISSFRLFVSKHLVYNLVKSGEDTKETIAIDPKKIALLEKLGLGEEQEDKSIIPMTGAELRKDRKNALRVIRNNEKHKIKSETRQVKVKVIPEKPIRFSLGCGIESLTASNLLDLVKSTAPYLFPESGPRIVIEEDDDFDDLNSFSRSYISAEDRNNALLEANSDANIEEHGENGNSGDINGRNKNEGGIDSNSNSFMSSSSPSSTASILAEVLLEDMTAVEKSQGPSGWLRILKNSNHIPNTNSPTEAQRIDYFALCMASHFCTVATFVPTDVGKYLLVLCT